MPTDLLLDRLCKYYASQLHIPISIYDQQNLAAMLAPYTEGIQPSINSMAQAHPLSRSIPGISYVDFYSLLGEWFVLAIKMAKKKMPWLWQQGNDSFVPLLFNPYRHYPAVEPSNGDQQITTGGGNGDDDEWTEDIDETTSRGNCRYGKRRSRSGSRIGITASANKKPEAPVVSPRGTIMALELTPVLHKKGDFLITIGPELKERNHGRSEGEEGRGVNYFPSLKYPLQIVYVVEDSVEHEASDQQAPSERVPPATPVVQRLSVENKLDKLTDFIHAKSCLQDYLVLQRDGKWKRVPKDKFGFNHAQQRRLEETLGHASLLPRDGSESISYAHA